MAHLCTSVAAGNHEPGHTMSHQNVYCNDARQHINKVLHEHYIFIVM